MTTYYEDDITGKQSEDEHSIREFGIIAHGGSFDTVDVHRETTEIAPEAVADELHDMVDEWLDDWVQHLEERDEEVSTI